MRSNIHKLSDTGLYQQEVFKILAEYELARSQRHPNPITLMHVSLKLKNNNSKIEDSLKQIFYSLLNTSLRVSDIPAHYDDDFLILMPVTNDLGGQAATLRLISRLKGDINTMDEEKAYKYSIHVGIASRSGGESVTLEKLMAEAKQAMGDARNQGPEAFSIYQRNEEDQ